ncbi:hypothetical protein AQUCO_03500093v1 [Aquilegia coerulea]|uniref:Uncharacterized protein n=1 Tax=Aquilegia coerulea TaxID=218851 RepID=A0A2G5CW35_AQUCA|nr:hypothetical protein AQUCO_03500093v1 [Aquilegia coerulea]
MANLVTWWSSCILKDEANLSNVERRKMSPSAPQPPPALTYLTKHGVNRMTTTSVTNVEIAKFWRKKKMDEEDHLLAAIKAAARVRARNFTEEEYKQFEESLAEENKEGKSNKDAKNKNKDENNKEIRIGIKDWWTKSKYAYLNQPAIETYL